LQLEEAKKKLALKNKTAAMGAEFSKEKYGCHDNAEFGYILFAIVQRT
jgi:hypothetical protein